MPWYFHTGERLLGHLGANEGEEEESDDGLHALLCSVSASAPYKAVCESDPRGSILPGERLKFGPVGGSASQSTGGLFLMGVVAHPGKDESDGEVIYEAGFLLHGTLVRMVAEGDTQGDVGVGESGDGQEGGSLQCDKCEVRTTGLRSLTNEGVLVDVERDSKVVAANTDLRGVLVPGDEVLAGAFNPAHVGGGTLSELGLSGGRLGGTQGTTSGGEHELGVASLGVGVSARGF